MSLSSLCFYQGRQPACQAQLRKGMGNDLGSSQDKADCATNAFPANRSVTLVSDATERARHCPDSPPGAVVVRNLRGSDSSKARALFCGETCATGKSDRPALRPVPDKNPRLGSAAACGTKRHRSSSSSISSACQEKLDSKPHRESECARPRSRSSSSVVQKTEKSQVQRHPSTSVEYLFAPTDCGLRLSSSDAIRALALSVVLPDEDMINSVMGCKPPPSQCSTGMNAAGCRRCYRRLHTDLFDVICDLRWIDRTVRWPFDEPADCTFLTSSTIACVYMAMIYGHVYMRSGIARAETDVKAAASCPWLLPGVSSDMTQVERDIVNHRCLLLVVLYIVYSYEGQQTAYLCWPFIHSRWSRRQFNRACLNLASLLSRPLLQFNLSRDLQWAYTVKLCQYNKIAITPSSVPCHCKADLLHRPANPRCLSVEVPSVSMVSRHTARRHTRFSGAPPYISQEAVGLTPDDRPAADKLRKVSTESGYDSAHEEAIVDGQMDYSCDLNVRRISADSYIAPAVWPSNAKKQSTLSSDSGLEIGEDTAI